MAFLHIAAGVMLILLGMRHLRKGLDRLFGKRLLEWLRSMTGSSGRALLAGLAAGVMAPSSTAIAVIAMQMLSQSALTAGRMLALMLGANIGITVAVQLLAWHLQDSAPFFIVAGGICFLFLSRSLFRGVGQVLLAFGFIFLASQLMSQAAAQVAAVPDLRLVFHVLEGYPWAVLPAAALLTVLLQSSTASIGLGIGLAQGGLVTLKTLLPWVLGANIGIALTALMAGWATLEGRRLGAGNLLLKAGAAVVLLATGMPLLARLPGNVAQQAANFNTLLNVAIALLALPLLGPLAHLLGFLIEAPPASAPPERESYLDETLLQSPSLALSQATREELRMLDELKLMLRAAAGLLGAGAPGAAAPLRTRVDQHSRRVDDTAEAIRLYLGQVGDESLSAEDTRWKFVLLDFSQELEAVGRLVRRDLSDAALRGAKLLAGSPPPPADRDEIEALVGVTVERMEKAAGVLMSRNRERAESLIQEKGPLNARCQRLQRSHADRLSVGAAGGPAAVGPAAVGPAAAAVAPAASAAAAAATAPAAPPGAAAPPAGGGPPAAAVGAPAGAAASSIVPGAFAPHGPAAGAGVLSGVGPGGTPGAPVMTAGAAAAGGARGNWATVFVDLVVCLRRINGHLTAVGYAVARPWDASEGSSGGGGGEVEDDVYAGGAAPAAQI